MDGACSTKRENDIWIQSFNWKAWRNAEMLGGGKGDDHHDHPSRILGGGQRVCLIPTKNVVRGL
jgi:hypothetical protein